MKKMKATVLIALSLLGCASDANKEELIDEATFDSREKMLVSSGNGKAVIDFYKDELQKRDSEEIRLRLVQAYININDYESAFFHLDDIEINDANVSKVAFLKAKVYLAMGDIESAYLRAQTALAVKSIYPEAENLMGLILAEKGDYQKSKEFFLLAKKHYYDDLTIANNLSVLDLLVGDYGSVIDRLQPFYFNGEADRTVKANLVLANAKLGRYQQVESILKEQGYKSEQIQKIFVILTTANNQQNLNANGAQLDIPVDKVVKKKVKVIQGVEYEAHN
ncbi:tetratricopeptide repeat protein [Vibrio sp. F74]|uniref:tetratricopeptide repeat protein n=1 Tax=Vibrio sp. F74 TaxID=700020 RepID=UPI0035F531A0